jgi:NAD(P)-dependent dehydrogenase (short-subunit alcohol dehydrogenase family)
MKTLKELMDLHGRVALITGGSGHIGFSIGEALAELGAKIAVLDLKREDCQRAGQELETRFGVETLAVAIDLADENSIRSVPQTVLDWSGRLDILVNCAALVGTSALQGWAVPFPQQSSTSWKLALDINLTAPFILTQVFSEALSASKHGSVINVGSIYGVVGPNWDLYAGTSMANPAAYGASKGGLVQLTRYLATTLAPDVRVNLLTPGGVFRNQPAVFVERYKNNTPLRRMAVEEDFKGAAAYLASDLSAYVTGQNLVVDGGWTVW